MAKCLGKYTGPIAVTGDLIKRGDVAEASLARCSAQIDAIRDWSNKPLPVAQ